MHLIPALLQNRFKFLDIYLNSTVLVGYAISVLPNDFWPFSFPNMTLYDIALMCKL